ncbi:MAG: LLM class F420-dependent oxidoreductase [Acidimicrobiia bacterium]|nr:LLM class F420-dependent oxidoreductase [Acidimicrobiia bacterium]
MRLALGFGYWSAGPPAGAVEQLATAERLGFDCAWTAEAYGSDALTPLAWWGASSETIGLGTSICQLSARTPAAMAMAAMTMDHLSGGRFRLGLGASGPQVVEGWYGEPYPKPLARTREYVEIIRKIWARDEPVTYDGEHYQLPYPGGAGLGKPLRSTVHPLRSDIPIYLGAEGPKNVALTAEIADGWLPLFFAPKDNKFYLDALTAGFGRAGGGKGLDSFDVAAVVPIVIDDDVEAAADAVRPMLALYAGGMGAKDANFHLDVFGRMGYEGECAKIQELYLAGDKRAAIAAVPTSMVEDIALVGPAAKIRDELHGWRETVVNTLVISGPPPFLETVAELVAY